MTAVVFQEFLCEDCTHTEGNRNSQDMVMVATTFDYRKQNGI